MKIMRARGILRVKEEKSVAHEREKRDSGREKGRGEDTEEEERGA